MGRVRGGELMPRAFDIDPERVLRDRQVIHSLCPAEAHDQHGQRVGFARAQADNLSLVGPGVDFQRLLIDEVPSKNQRARIILSEFAPSLVVFAAADSERRELP